VVKVLIVGGNGNIGKILLRALSSANLYSTTRSGGGGTLALDLNHPERFNYNFLDDGDFVLMLAANSSPKDCTEKYEEVYKTNFRGTNFFINKCLVRNANVLFFSSDNVYAGGNELYDEKSECVPANSYGKMKLNVEKRFESHENFKVFRLSYVLHYDDNFTKFMRSCVKGNKLVSVFQPFVRSSVGIQDLVLAVENLIKNWDKIDIPIFNICGVAPTERFEITESYKRNVNSNLRYEIVKPEAGFFDFRQEIIKIKSLYFRDLLGRKPCDLDEVYKELKRKN
jgi:dTDP-4-dehydrorhamnose reductase